MLAIVKDAPTAGSTQMSRLFHARPRGTRKSHEEEKPDLIVPQVEAIATDKLIRLKIKVSLSYLQQRQTLHGQRGIRKLAAEIKVTHC